MTISVVTFEKQDAPLMVVGVLCEVHEFARISIAECLTGTVLQELEFSGDDYGLMSYLTLDHLMKVHRFRIVKGDDAVIPVEKHGDHRVGIMVIDGPVPSGVWSSEDWPKVEQELQKRRKAGQN